VQAARRKLSDDSRRTDNPGQLGMLLPEPEVAEPVGDQDGAERAEILDGLREVLDLLRYGRRSW
jgi:hypothetical protein